jgi:hypothetical protein
MSQRFLVMGDNHGDTESLQRLLDDVDGESFDFAVHVGDLTDAMRQGRDVAAEQLRAVEPFLDAIAGRAHFCGNTHVGRYRGRRLNSAFLQYTHRETGEQAFGGYFFVDVEDSPPFEVEMRSIGSLDRFECDQHRERGVQFHAGFGECAYCAEPKILMREMAASAFYGLADDDSQDTVTDDELVEYAAGLWTDPPVEFRSDFRGCLDEIEGDRYAPLARTDDGDLALADDSYGY